MRIPLLVIQHLNTELASVDHQNIGLYFVAASIQDWLTYLPLDKIAAISQKTFSSAFSWMKSFVLWLKFHWSLFQWFQLTINQHWPNRQQAIIWTNADLFHWCIFAALEGDELISSHYLMNYQISSLLFVPQFILLRQIFDNDDECRNDFSLIKKIMSFWRSNSHQIILSHW